MEVKWFMIFLAVGAVSLAVGVSISNHYDTQCKLAAIQSNMSLADIKEVCK